MHPSCAHFLVSGLSLIAWVPAPKTVYELDARADFVGNDRDAAAHLIARPCVDRMRLDAMEIGDQILVQSLRTGIVALMHLVCYFLDAVDVVEFMQCGDHGIGLRVVADQAKADDGHRGYPREAA